MLDKSFADKCYKETYSDWSNANTLRQFISAYFNCSIENNSIEKWVFSLNYNRAVIYNWAGDNNMSYDEFHNFIMSHLDSEVNYVMHVDSSYDEPVFSIGPDSNLKYYKEVRFVGRVEVDKVSLDLDEWFDEFEVA